MKKNEELSLLEWNLNFGSRDDAEPAEFIGEYLKRYDIAILTEVRANEALTGMLEERGYDYAVSDDQGEYSNQVVIAARKGYGLRKIAGGIRGGDPAPDFLHAVITPGGRTINLFGIRVKVTDFQKRFEQVRLIKEYTASVPEAAIIGGDFNSAQIRGDADADYDQVEELYHYRAGKKQLSNLRFYNFHLIRDLFSDRFRLREPEGEKNSWGLCLFGERLVYGPRERIKNDLLLYSEEIKNGSGVCYSWEYVRKHEEKYRTMLRENAKKSGNSIMHGYPDHVGLTFRFSLMKKDA